MKSNIPPETQKVVKEILADAKTSEHFILARGKSTEELIDLAVTGFREMMEEMEDMEPDFSESTINSYSFFVPVILLIEK